MAERLPLIFLLASNLFVSAVFSMSILTIDNQCNNTVWPVIFSSQSPVSSTTGFTLKSGEARFLFAPSTWYGLISGRTLCSTDSTGNFSCVTGDCESGKISCPGNYDWSPVTYAYFTLNKGGIDSYFISVEHGYNLPLRVVPSQSSRTCISSGCVVDLNKTCPNDLKKLVEGKPIACTSVCQESKTHEYCCTGDFESKQKSKPTVYTQNFEHACPFAHSCAYNDKNSTFVCPKSTDFVITFCPSSNISNNTRGNNRSSMAPLSGPKHNSLQKLKPILGTTFIATTSLLLLHIFKIFN